MMNPKSAFETDDRGVSPVIGVILMVAITVILAAVIGTFVLNLGGDLQETPQAQLSIEATNGSVEISHGGGDTLQTGNLRLSADSSGGFNDQTGFSSDEFSVGNSTTINSGALPGSGSEVTIQIIHTPSESILVESTVTVP